MIRRLFAILAVRECIVGATCALILGGLPVRAAELISDGGFEAGSISYADAPLPVCSTQWCAATGNMPVDFVNSPVHGGQKALRLDTSTSVRGRFVYQDIAQAGSCFTLNFSVYRESGINSVALEANWDRGATGSSTNVSGVAFNDGAVTLAGWDAIATVNTPLTPGTWHNVIIETNGEKGTQALTIDGALVATISRGTNVDYAAPTTLLMGDTSGSANHGNYLYDDVSISTHTCVSDVTCPVIPDADGDGIPNVSDVCANTPAGAPVDGVGCSQGQFCAGIDATTRSGARLCKLADWKNDEAIMKGKEADCNIDKGGRGQADDRCVPRE